MNGPNRDDWERLLDINGDHVLVTGGCGDIGLGIARAFLERDRQGTLVDLNIEPGTALAAGHERISLIELDLADSAAVEMRLRPLRNHPARRMSSSMASAGRPRQAPKASPGRPGKCLWSNSAGSWQATLPRYSDAPASSNRPCWSADTGGIINIASLSMRIGGAVAPVHCGSGKSGVPGLTKVVARELGGAGLTINAINPGRIDTKTTKDVPAEVNQAIATRIPVGRLGLPGDVVKVCLFWPLTSQIS